MPWTSPRISSVSLDTTVQLTSRSKLRTFSPTFLRSEPVTLLGFQKSRSARVPPYSWALTEYHAIKAYCGSGGIPPRISALDGGEWSASSPGHFTPREGTPATHWIGGWVVPRAGINAGGEEKNSQPLPGLEPSIIQPKGSQLSYVRSTE
jgi:hypothetical protein